MNTEEWRTIPDFPSYAISSLGRVRRIVDSKTAKAKGFLKVCDAGRYSTVVLRRDGKSYTKAVHRLLALTFLGPPPSSKHEAAHVDGDSIRNHIGNISWKLPVENTADKELHGTMLRGESHPNCQLTEDQIRDIRHIHKMGLPRKDIAFIYDKHPGYISLIINRKRWKHVA